MHDQLLGTTQPVLSISLEPGERIIAEVGGFAWMTDSIAMVAADDARREPRLCVYTATSEAGVVAFAAKLPGRILSVEVGPGYEGCLVRESSFLAGTPGVRIAAEASPLPAGSPGGQGLALWRIGGSGRAWVELPGDVVRRELTAASRCGPSRSISACSMPRSPSRSRRSRASRAAMTPITVPCFPAREWCGCDRCPRARDMARGRP